MAKAMPMPISATTLDAFKVIADLRAWTLPSRRVLHRPEAFLRYMNQAFQRICSPAAPIYRRLYREHLIEIGLAECFIEDVDLNLLLHHDHPPEPLIRAILAQGPRRPLPARGPHVLCGRPRPAGSSRRSGRAALAATGTPLANRGRLPGTRAAS